MTNTDMEYQRALWLAKNLVTYSPEVQQAILEDLLHRICAQHGVDVEELNHWGQQSMNKIYYDALDKLEEELV
jgi:hypothetical protein